MNAFKLFNGKNTFISLILFWFTLSVFFTFYNILKSYSEVKTWWFISDYKKRELIFGDLHNLLSLIKNNTPSDASILIYSKDVKTFYLSIYYLYPRKITIVDNLNDFDAKLNVNSYSYIALYKQAQVPKGYSLISKLTNIGEIYKK